MNWSWNFYFKEAFDSFPDFSSLGMQVNHSCQILFWFGTGINSAGYVLPQRDTFYLSVQGVPGQRVSTSCCGCCQPGWEKEGALNSGKRCLKAGSAHTNRSLGWGPVPWCVWLQCPLVRVSAGEQRLIPKVSPPHLAAREGRKLNTKSSSGRDLLQLFSPSNLFGYVVHANIRTALGLLQLKTCFVFCWYFGINWKMNILLFLLWWCPQQRSPQIC